MTNIFLGLALFFVILFVVFAMMIVHEVARRGVKINFLLLKLYIIKYIYSYKKITLNETGRIGPLYYPCVGSANLALILALLGLLLS